MRKYNGQYQKRKKLQKQLLDNLEAEKFDQSRIPVKGLELGLVRTVKCRGKWVRKWMLIE
jgi:hypothetical protein